LAPPNLIYNDQYYLNTKPQIQTIMRTLQKSIKLVIFSIAMMLVCIPYVWSQSAKQNSSAAPGSVETKMQEAPESAVAALKQFKADSQIPELNEMRLSILKLKAELETSQESGSLNSDQVAAYNEKIAAIESQMTPLQVREREIRMELQNKQAAMEKPAEEVKQPAQTQNASPEERQRRVDAQNGKQQMNAQEAQTKQPVQNASPEERQKRMDAQNGRQQMSAQERQARQDAQTREYEAIKRNHESNSASRQSSVDNTQITAPVKQGPQDERYQNLPSVIAMKNFKADSPVESINDLRYTVLELKFHIEAGQLKNSISQQEIAEYQAKIANIEAQINSLLPLEKAGKNAPAK
jgi:hypothetical protein